jgi:hypothetical protein
MKTARRIAATKALVASAGLVVVGSAIATGNWPVLMIAAAAIGGAGLLAAWSDMRAVEARCEATRMRNETSAVIEPGRDVQPDIQDTLADLKTYYARSARSLESGEGRFQERVSSAVKPQGYRYWD